MTATPKKITEFNEITSPTVDDVIPGVTDTGSSPITGKIKLSSVLALLPAASTAEINAGTDANKKITPSGLAGSAFGKRTVDILLNDSVALTTSAKGYVRIPSWMDGWSLVAVAAMCVVASSGDAPTFTVKNGATSMLTTNLTIDASETDSSTATTAAVIDTDHDAVATGNHIEVACSVSGTGVTYAVVELTFALA